MAVQSGAIRAGRAFVELFADDSKLARGLKAAQAKLSAFGSAVRGIGYRLTAAGAAITAPLTAAAAMSAESGARLYDMARRTGLSVEALSALSYAAERSGTDLETVERAVRIMQRTIGGLKDDVEGTTGGLEHLGLAAADIKGLSVEEQFAAIARAIAAVPGATDRAAAALKVFGRSGTMLLPMLEDFDQLSAAARGMGLVRSARSAAEAKAFADAMTMMGQAAKNLWSVLGQAVMPILKEKAQLVMRLVLGLRDWINQNRGLVATVFQVALAVSAAGVAAVVLGTAISFLAKTVGILAAVLPLVRNVLGAVGGIITWMLSPVVLLAGGLALLGAYFVKSTGVMGQASDWLAGKFQGLKNFALGTFQGIADALAAGDIPLAAKVLWAALKAAWTEGTTWISSIWQDALLWCKEKFAEAWGGIRIIFSTIAHGLTVAWIETTSFMSKVWTDFTGWVVKAWAWACMELQKLWNWTKSAFTDFDAEAANRQAEAAFEAKKQEIEREAEAKKRAVEEERKARREQETREYQEGLKQIVDETEARKAAFKREHDEKIKKANEELEAARKEWRQAVDAAKAKRKDKELEGGGPPKAPEAEDLLAKLKKDLGGLPQEMQKVANVTRGIFNPEALLSLKMGAVANPIKQVAAATAATRDSARKIADNTNRLVVLAENANVFT